MKVGNFLANSVPVAVWGGISQHMHGIAVPPWRAGVGVVPGTPIPGAPPPLTWGIGAGVMAPCPDNVSQPAGYFDYQGGYTFTDQYAPAMPPAALRVQDSLNRVTEVRVLVVLDRTPSLGVPSWNDIMDTGLVGGASHAVTCLYDIPALSRFEVVHDNTFTPQFSSTNVTVIQHMKACKIDVVFNDNTSATDQTGIEENAVYLFVAAGDLLGDPAPLPNFSVDGWFRILYSDN